MAFLKIKEKIFYIWKKWAKKLSIELVSLHANKV